MSDMENSEMSAAEFDELMAAEEPVELRVNLDSRKSGLRVSISTGAGVSAGRVHAPVVRSTNDRHAVGA